eukprot:CAMPEP_0201281062 /NCGR_PEP_ID=MMETSP1317-20130820/1191_1 /ASSEMBLY_ACC=CAM_ASM_000770 /TAXON_ID=187299 /ORGANISM="Undescribed Undescribed, Strain Undescribed" /LENGTH=48 /DNA_ID= /DNA_START= /DNA_END= /DNA_ORIENTATION=
MTEMDANKDGKVSIEEFKFWFRSGRTRPAHMKKLSMVGRKFDSAIGKF